MHTPRRITSEAHAQRPIVIASLGPRAFDTTAWLRSVCAAGPDGLRINCSHTSGDEAQRAVHFVRENYPLIGILLDLQGAKLRVGSLPQERMLTADQTVVFVDQSDYETATSGDFPPEQAVVPVRTPFPFRALAGADEIRIKDGSMVFRVTENMARERGRLVCVTMKGGVVRAEKGMNAPGIDRSRLGLLTKDIEDIELGRRLGVDAICVSFVTGDRELRQAREAIGAGDWRPEVWAKVECREAITNLGEIFPAADAVLVGRGDLAGELGPDRVDVETRGVISASVERAVPCLVGTGLMESMRHMLHPNKEERDAIERFVHQGVRGFLLTSETSVGEYPAQTIATLRAITAPLTRTRRPGPVAAG